MAQRIAIIGSGMAGLAASWFLGEAHQVTLFERQPRIGIGAHSVQAPGGPVDVPLRVIYPGYYPELFALLARTGVPVEPLDASMGFSDLGQRTYFRYRNFHALGKSIPWVTPDLALKGCSRRILWDLARFMWQTPGALQAGQLADCTLGAYLERGQFSRDFGARFLIPAFAGINTVACQEVRDTPAQVIAQYFNPSFLSSSVYRAVGGASALARALSGRVHRQELQARIASVRRRPRSVLVTLEDGSDHSFDAVVFATQANQVGAMLQDASAQENTILQRVHYGNVRVLMHHDERLMPASHADWSAVNYLMSPQWDRPMVSIWVNRLLPAYQDARPLFQTIHPQLEPRAGLVLQDIGLQRPVVDMASQANLEALAVLHREPGRRVFFCGSYAAQGIPLLESAVSSAKALLQAEIFSTD